MRTLTALLFALTLVLTGCSQESSEPAAQETASQEADGPEDTLPVLGAWESEPIEQSGRRLTLTLSDDNTYVATDGCVELPGRWDLAGGQVRLKPDRDGEVQCGAVADTPVTLPTAFAVEGDRLVPDEGDLVFTKS
ncbi:hypothetical protein [Aeromicrobium duanguangcaii]|uniref:hypothetical protein n=1 Tax=Aeromicrobium duanguangcaii TaxID=2968086 RepID=UPI0020178215|nr:hypothetical protein [Aeromicrobium duanguangcaii]MCL3838762.1 hypothetical protein [Aeromicrobium duanguangcaii]